MTEYLLLGPEEIKGLIQTGIGLGHAAADMNIPLDRAIADATSPGPIDRLLDGLKVASDLRRAAEAMTGGSP